jgi:hypothetical protein
MPEMRRKLKLFLLFLLLIPCILLAKEQETHLDSLGGVTFISSQHFNVNLIKNKTQLKDTIPAYSIVTPGLSLGFDRKGQITHCTMSGGKVSKKLTGGSALIGFKPVGQVIVKRLQDGGYQFTRRMVNARRDSCEVSDRFTPTKNSIHWEMTVISNAKNPWTTPLILSIKYPDAPETNFWTTWVNRSLQNQKSTKDSGSNLAKKLPANNSWDMPLIPWDDPLIPMGLMENCWNYGNWNYDSKEGGGICIPIATMLDKNDDIGLSLVISPEQPLLWLQLKTSSDGTMLFQHNLLRLGNSHKVIFSADIVKHESDWRGGLRWMVGRYPQYFDPPNPGVNKMAGMGAYSHYQGEIDKTYFKKMSFRINWDASFEWPYFGMFFPPVKKSIWWKSGGADVSGAVDPSLIKNISYQSINNYSRAMLKMGFFVLNYFNLTEFGSKISETPVINKDLSKESWWTDANTYLYRQMPEGIFRNNEDAGVVYSWGNSVVMDPGDSGVQDNLLRQARYFADNLSSSAGICIDRMDHLLRINFARGADDKVGWYNDRSGRFLGLSWISIMSKIGPIIHKKNKVIFVNPVRYGHRLEWFKEVDGIYDEAGFHGYALNGSGLLALRKPALMWTGSVNSIQPDADLYFQRHLYMGAYPTAPFPGNDHTIRPDPKVDQYYLDYGPLFDAIRGKKWVLAPHCVQTTTAGVKVNLFQVTDGYALPVTFGDTTSSATVIIRNLKYLNKMTCKVLLPGSVSSEPISTNFKDGVLELKVPLSRGCALVKMSIPKEEK